MYQSDRIIKWAKENIEIEKNSTSIGLEIDIKHIENEEWEHLEKAIFDMLSSLYSTKHLLKCPIAVFVGRNEYSGLKRFGIHIEFSGGS